MALNFRIVRHRNHDGLHLKLMGDFDGSSAKELLNVLEDPETHVSTIFIHANGLKDIHPFGKRVFEKGFSMINRSSLHVVFTGERGGLAP